ncbi:MAG: ketopantoate reductase family protein [Spirochaetales bacterium]
MKKIEHVLIAGAGAVGLTVAHQLFKYNPKAISILAHSDRLVRYKKNGLHVNSEKIDFHLVDAKNPQLPTESGKAELVIIACKNEHLPAILDDLQHCIGENSLILSLLNGISSETMIAQRYGEEKNPLAMILGTDAQHNAEYTVYNETGIIYFGDNENVLTDGKVGTQCTQRIRLIADFFESAHIHYDVPENMLRKLWYKFMMNVGINQASAVLRLPYSMFQTTSPDFVPEARELMRSLMREVLKLSELEGIGKGKGGALSENDIEACCKTLDTLTSASRTSMCQDVLAGRKTEAELFSKTVSDLGKKHAVATPINDTLYLQLRTIEQSYGKA